MTMMKHWVFAALLSLATFGAGDASALSYLMMADETLFKQADGVALFEVASVAASPKDGETRYSLQLVQRLSGAALAQSETLALPGYVAKDERFVFDGVPFLPTGQRVLLFYARRDDGALQAMQLTLGMFFPVSTHHGEVYLRYLGAGNDVSNGKNASYAQARDARGFEHWIRRRGAGVDASADYLVDATQLREKFNIIQINFEGSNPPPSGPARWFQFDEATPLRWFAAADGQQGTTVDEFSLLQQSIASWVSDPGSLILMNYSGIGNSVQTNSANVTWNDPQNRIPGDFTCPGGGILGAGGSLVATPSRTFDGAAWYPRRNGVLLTQPGTGCFFNQYGVAAGVEFFVHEIGHVLGFAHSCGQDVSAACQAGSVADQATMRDVLHVDGRGGTLQADDIAAARFVYPEFKSVPTADLSISIDASTALVPIGEGMTYTITVANAGPDQAASLVVTQTLPPETQFEGASGSGWSCKSAIVANLTCTRDSLDSGASTMIEVLIDIPEDYTGAIALNSQVSVASTTEDPVSGNNGDSIITKVDTIVGRIFGNSFE